MQWFGLSRWSTGNALALLAGVVAVACLHRPWPLAVVASASFAVLLAASRGAWTPQGRFGAANFVTALRLLACLALATLFHGGPGGLWAAAVPGILVLDALDGWLARRAELASAFGAHFDMETDALLVLAVGLELWLRGSFGVWILTSGLLRYAYVLVTALVPPRGGDMPRTRLGRCAFGLLVGGLCCGLALPGFAGALGAALGTFLVALSFARSFRWSYGRRAS
jgi:phosphatidylglycerophosphate synthase